MQQTARSVNIKERLDFSCAIFDSNGDLIANAPHTPVHLGSMDRSVASVIQAHPIMHKGDVFATNAPYNGGTHLPDITVITPALMKNNKANLFRRITWTSCRYWWYSTRLDDPLATHIEDEGVILNNIKLVSEYRFLHEEISQILTENKYPCRNPEQNIADLKAQIAANEKGVLELNSMVSQFSLKAVEAYKGYIQDYAENCIRRMISKINDGKAEIYFDQGLKFQFLLQLIKLKKQQFLTSRARVPNSLITLMQNPSRGQ